MSGSAKGRSAVSFKSKSHVFQCLVNGTAAPFLSCQFGTMFTEPAVPHSLQTRRRPIVDQGRSWVGRLNGHRPSADRNYRPNIGCCRLCDRLRSIPPGLRGRLIVRVAAKPSPMIPQRSRHANYQSLGVRSSCKLQRVVGCFSRLPRGGIDRMHSLGAIMDIRRARQHTCRRYRRQQHQVRRR